MTDWAARVLNFKRGELRLALLAALFYFCVLSGYFFLRPVRDAMGVARGMDELRWLFVATSVALPDYCSAFRWSRVAHGPAQVHSDRLWVRRSCA